MCLHADTHTVMWEGREAPEFGLAIFYGNGDVTKLSNKTQSWAFYLSNEVTEVAYVHRTTGGRLTNFHKGSF